MRYITEAYKGAATAKLLWEANTFAEALRLDENTPIREQDLTEVRIDPPFLSDHGQGFGSISTSKYHYFASVGKKLSYVVRNFGVSGGSEPAFLDSIKKRYMAPKNEMNTNAAYALAANWLNSVGVSVKELEGDSSIEVLAWDLGGKFVPVYWVRWLQPASSDIGKYYDDKGLETVAMIQLVLPERLLLQMHVEKPHYLKRDPLTLPDRDKLLQQTADPEMRKMWFTTDAYKKAALTAALGEANRACEELELPQKLPIKETDLVEVMIATPYFAEHQGGFGTIATENFVFGFDNYRLSYVNRNYRLRDDEFQYLAALKKRYPSPPAKTDANLAYSLATQWLAHASIDVQGLERECQVRLQPVKVDEQTIPLYRIHWVKGSTSNQTEAAGVEVLVPARQLQKLWIEKAEYSQRRTLTFPDLERLLSRTNDVSSSESGR